MRERQRASSRLSNDLLYKGEVMEIFQTRLREVRKNAGFSQETVAKELGISYRNYRRYETGECEPGFFSVVKIAEYFQVSLDYLAGRSDTP